jgi:hypothetical protein
MYIFKYYVYHVPHGSPRLRLCISKYTHICLPASWLINYNNQSNTSSSVFSVNNMIKMHGSDLMVKQRKYEKHTPACKIVEGQFPAFQRFSSSKLVLKPKTVESRFLDLGCFANGSTHCHYTVSIIFCFEFFFVFSLMEICVKCMCTFVKHICITILLMYTLAAGMLMPVEV